MISDPFIMKAVSSIRQRSERELNTAKILGTFVDVGILPHIQNANNQVMYGRRGTGKTHILRVLASRLKESPQNAVVYIDLRTTGSTSQFSDPSVQMKIRCLAMFRDVLVAIYDVMLEHIVNQVDESHANAALTALEEFGRAALEPDQTAIVSTVVTREAASQEDRSQARAVLSAASEASIETLSGAARESEKTVSTAVQTEDKIIFPALHKALDSLLVGADATLHVLLDEWSSIPVDLQPYLAEFLKRSFLVDPRIVVKIASLEYRSCFSLAKPNGLVGFELGADIAANLDIDDYYVFDRSPKSVTDTFADILYRHVNSELPEGYLLSLGISDARGFVLALFTNTETFSEMVRASEGVVRDLISIFSMAFFNAQRSGQERIDKKGTLNAAGHWFEEDKAPNLDDGLQTALRRIVDEVIGKKRARSFLLERNLERHKTIQRLIDLRVLHLMRRGYADKDNPGIRYNIYTLDYGTYVDLINTSKQPQLALSEIDSVQEPAENLVVPFDDKRSIRRIVLTANFLDGT